MSTKSVTDSINIDPAMDLPPIYKKVSLSLNNSLFMHSYFLVNRNTDYYTRELKNLIIKCDSILKGLNQKLLIYANMNSFDAYINNSVTDIDIIDKKLEYLENYRLNHAIETGDLNKINSTYRQIKFMKTRKKYFIDDDALDVKYRTNSLLNQMNKSQVLLVKNKLRLTYYNSKSTELTKLLGEPQKNPELLYILKKVIRDYFAIVDELVSYKENMRTLIITNFFINEPFTDVTNPKLLTQLLNHYHKMRAAYSKVLRNVESLNEKIKGLESRIKDSKTRQTLLDYMDILVLILRSNIFMLTKELEEEIADLEVLLTE